MSMQDRSEASDDGAIRASMEALANASEVCREFFAAEGSYGERWIDDWNQLWGASIPASERAA